MEEGATYIKGFNAGYYLSDRNPELITLLEPSLTGETEFLEGLADGIEQYRKEHELSNERLEEIEDIREGQSEEQELER